MTGKPHLTMMQGSQITELKTIRMALPNLEKRTTVAASNQLPAIR
jgi:hypothetical protein